MQKANVTQVSGVTTSYLTNSTLTFEPSGYLDHQITVTGVTSGTYQIDYYSLAGSAVPVLTTGPASLANNTTTAFVYETYGPIVGFKITYTNATQTAVAYISSGGSTVTKV